MSRCIFIYMYITHILQHVPLCNVSTQHKREREAHRRTRESLEAAEDEYKKLKDSRFRTYD